MKAKLIYVLIVVMLLSVLLSGCNNMLAPLFGLDPEPVPFTFRQERSLMKKVVIGTYVNGFPVGPTTPILQLSEAQIDDFYNEMLKVECDKVNELVPPIGYGDVVFMVTYTDGETEMISFVRHGYVAPDGSYDYTNKIIDKKALSKVFAQFVSPEELSEASERFRHYWYSVENE